MVLGLLGGMGVMHIIFIAAQKDNTTFYTTYSDFGNLICIIFQVMSNLTLVFGLALTFIYKNKSDEKMHNLAPNRHEFKEHLVLGIVTQILVFCAWILLHIQPKYTNKFYYLQPSQIQDSDYMVFKILAYLADGFLIVSWIVASIYNKAAIENMSLDPEDEENDKPTQADEDADNDEDQPRG